MTAPQTPTASLAAGQALVAASAMAFAGNAALARLSYDGGMDPLTVNLARALVASLALAGILAAQRVPLGLPARARRIAVGCGVLTAIYSYMLFAAIAFTPIALVVIAFYTFPLLTGALAWITGRDRFSWRAGAALALAFAGLLLALDPAGTVDRRGILLGLAAAVLVTANIHLLGGLVGGRDSRPVTLHVQATATVLFAAAAAFTGHLAVPTAPVGWLGLLAVPLLYTFAFTGLYAGIARIGPVRTATLMNLEPVAGVAFGWLLLGQALKPVQLAGVALVIAALLLARRRA